MCDVGWAVEVSCQQVFFTCMILYNLSRHYVQSMILLIYFSALFYHTLVDRGSPERRHPIVPRVLRTRDLVKKMTRSAKSFFLNRKY